MSFQRNEEGHVAILFALMSVVVTGMTGMAVDYARALSARDHMQAAADAAAMAGVALTGANATNAARETTARNVFAANMKGYNLTDMPVVTATASNGAVTVTATGSIPTAFSALVGINSLAVTAEGNATMSGQSLEVAMMIDLTGSMGQTRNGATKIAGLKDAASDLLDIFFPGGAQDSTTTRIAVAPFADYVNAGEFAARVTGNDADGATSSSGSASKLYSKRYNLKNTKQGSYTGTYTGLGCDQRRRPRLHASLGLRRRRLRLDGGCRLDLHLRPLLAVEPDGPADCRPQVQQRLQRRRADGPAGELR